MSDSPTVTAEKAFWRNLFHINNTVVRITINGEKTSILVPKRKVAKSVLNKRQVSLGEIAQMSAQKEDNIDAACKILSSIKDSNQQKTFISTMIKQTARMGQNIGVEFAAKVVSSYLGKTNNDTTSFMPDVVLKQHDTHCDFQKNLTKSLIEKKDFKSIAKMIDSTYNNQTPLATNVRNAILSELNGLSRTQQDEIVNNVNAKNKETVKNLLDASKQL